MKTLSLDSIILIVSVLFLSACKKDEGSACSSTAHTVRQINNAPATVKYSNGEYFLFENGSIDGELRACNELPEAFRVNNLAVFITGEVKETDHSGEEICCTEDFVIHDIH